MRSLLNAIAVWGERFDHNSFVDERLTGYSDAYPGSSDAYPGNLEGLPFYLDLYVFNVGWVRLLVDASVFLVGGDLFPAGRYVYWQGA